MTKRIISLVLVLLVLIPFVVSCKKNNETSGESGSSDVVSTNQGEETTDKYDVSDDIGTRDYGGRTITIAQTGHQEYDNEVSVERMTGDVVNDAIYKRNATVEFRLNVKIKNMRMESNSLYSVVNDLEKNFISGSVSYDLIHNPVYTAAYGAMRGLFHDLKQIDSIDLSKEYWSNYVNDALEVGGIQYVASGAIALNFYRFTWVTVVNDGILEANSSGAPDLFKVVEEGEWTIEYQNILANQYYSDLGVAGKDEEDQFGLVTTTGICVDPYMSSGEVKVLTKGADGYLSWDFNLDRAVSVMEDVTDLYRTNAVWCPSDDDQTEVAKMFGQGNALMATLRLIQLEDAAIRNMSDTYTILPVPRYSEDQDAYYSFTHDSFSGVAMPATVSADDKDVMGAVLEVMASESYRQVTPAYYEIVLKTRYSEHPENWEVLDMIMSNVKMDPVIPYTAALSFEGMERNTVIKLWRWTCAKSYRNGTAPEMSSAFTPDLESKMNENLNGANGLNTYFKSRASQ